MDIYQAAEQHKVDIEDILQDMKRELDNYKELAEKTKESLKESRERIALGFLFMRKTILKKIVGNLLDKVRKLYMNERSSRNF